MSDLEVPMSEVTLVRGALAPSIEVTFYDNGQILDLTGGTSAKFTMCPVDAINVPTIDGADAEIVEPATDGVMRYVLDAGDSDVPGFYLARFTVTVDSVTYNAPYNGWILVNIIR